MHHEIVSAGELDFEQYVHVQREAFAAHLEKYDVDTGHLKESYFRWKYLPPWGEAKVAVAYDQGQLVAATAAVPLRLESQSSTVQAWRAVDVATIPKARGQGLFTRMLTALKESLSEGEILFSFPNANSTPGFEKVGSTPIEEIPTWVRFVPPKVGRAGNPGSLKRYTESTENEFAVEHLLQSIGECTRVARDHTYFKWRYIDNPVSEYRIAANGEGGFVVFREMEVFNRRAVILLEMWTAADGTLKTLLRDVASYCQQRSIRFIITITSLMNWVEGLRHYFLQVPSLLSPKRQVLHGFAGGETARRALTNGWCITMGDLLEF